MRIMRGLPIFQFSFRSGKGLNCSSWKAQARLDTAGGEEGNYEWRQRAITLLQTSRLLYHVFIYYVLKLRQFRYFRGDTFKRLMNKMNSQKYSVLPFVTIFGLNSSLASHNTNA